MGELSRRLIAAGAKSQEPDVEAVGFHWIRGHG
jgi:hypothetical protein